MAESQYVIMEIHNDTDVDLHISGATLSWGKFYDCKDKSVTIPPTTIDNVTIPAGEIVKVCACGDDGSASGSEGQIELRVSEGNLEIGSFAWKSPYSGDNNASWTQQPNETKYLGSIGSYNTGSGALGTVDITIAKSA